MENLIVPPALLSDNRSRLEFLWKERESFLWCAADEFAKASEAHAGLERIYTSATDFEKVEHRQRDIISKIEGIFSE